MEDYGFELGRRDFVVTSLDGTIEFSAIGARRSIDDCFRQAIRGHISGLEHGCGPVCARLTDGTPVSSVRLDGPQGARYLIVLSEGASKATQADALTRRQLEIAEYAAVGATSKEIAKSLKISPLTVKTHLRTIYERLEVGNRIELADALKPRR